MVESSTGIRCPFCGSVRTHVVDTKHVDRLQGQKRRRECLDCERKFNTIEEYMDDRNGWRNHYKIDVNEVEAGVILDGELTSWVVKYITPKKGDILRFVVRSIVNNDIIESGLDKIEYEITCVLAGRSYGLNSNCMLCSFRPFNIED